MSTFLELVQALHREVGAAGVAPTTVGNQRGELRRLVGWVRRADTYVQNLWENWKFKRAAYSEVTSVGSRILPVAQNPAWYDPDTFRIIEEGTTEEMPIDVVEYDSIKGEIRETDSGFPYRVVIMPDNTLQVDPPANGAHTIKCDYYVDPVEMTADTDISIIPARFHRVILGRAMILYGNFENAPEIKTQGQEIYMEELARLENSQLPNKFGSRYRTGGHFEVIAE